MKIYKRPNSKYYWFKFTFDGELIQKSTQMTNKKDAELVASTFRNELVLGKIGIKPKKAAPTFEKAVTDYLKKVNAEHSDKINTIKRYTGDCKTLLSFFGKNTGIDELTLESCENFKIWRSTMISPKTKRKIAPVSINHELFTLKTILQRSVDADILLKNPARKVKPLKVPKREICTYSEVDKQRYLSACPQPLRDVALLVFELGMRPDEILNLTRRDIFFDEDFLLIREGKTESAKRKIFLTEKSTGVLRLRSEFAERLFDGVTVNSIDSQHSKVRKRIGLAANIRLYRAFL